MSVWQAARTRHFVRPLAGLWLSLAFISPAPAHQGLRDQIEELDLLIAREPGDVGLYLRRGELHRAHGDLDSALRDFDRARTFDPVFAEAAFHLGRALLDAGRPADATRALDPALLLRPDHVGALVVRGRALARLGRHVEAAGAPHPMEALRGLDKGISRLGPAVSLQLAAIDLEVRLGRHDDALARLEVAAARSRIQGQWLARRGGILLAAGRPAQARAAYEAALASIRALPARRRSSDAVATLETSVVDALFRLRADGDGPKVRR